MSFTQYPRAATGASIGSTVTGATQGSVLFAGAVGVLAQNNAAFFWDDTNKRLTITGATNTDTLRLNSTDPNYGTSLSFCINSTPVCTIAPDYNGTLVLNAAPTKFINIGGGLCVGGKLQVQGYVYEDGGNVVQINARATNVGLHVRLAAAQVSDAFQVYASDGTTKLFNVGPTGYIETIEQTAPAAPAANGVRIYAQDNGAGKTQLMALFSSGAAQQIAIQP